jgi:hypothetical protein
MRQYLWVEARPIVFQQERSSIVLDAQGTVSTAPPRIHKFLKINPRDEVALRAGFRLCSGQAAQAGNACGALNDSLRHSFPCLQRKWCNIQEYAHPRTLLQGG